MGNSTHPRPAISDFATRQHGAISTTQLRRLGYSDAAIRTRLLAGYLHRMHRGVYAVGHRGLSFEGRCVAAVLALGLGHGEPGPVLDCWGAAVSHRSAAAVWGLLPVIEGGVDVIVPGTSGRANRSGIRVHRSRSLARREVTMRRGVPVTTTARTVADLRRAYEAGWPGGVNARELRRAVRQADVLGLPLGDFPARDSTRGDLESAFLRICRQQGLSRPEVNVRIGPYLVDFLWSNRRFVVETDSYLHHRGKAAFQDDRARDLDLRRLGFDVLRLSEQQIDDEPKRVAEVLGVALSQRKDSQPDGETVSPER